MFQLQRCSTGSAAPQHAIPTCRRRVTVYWWLGHRRQQDSAVVHQREKQ